VTEYALLVLPSTNRVYGQAAPALAAAELAALSQLSLGGRVTDVGELMLAGVPYVRFRSSDPLSPAELTVKVGTTVTWKNHDDIPHTVVSAGKFRSKTLDTDEGFSFTFTAAGGYKYFCSLHPHMTGMIKVE